MGLKGAFEVCSEQVYRRKVQSFGCLNACSRSLISDLVRRTRMKTKKVIAGVVSGPLQPVRCSGNHCSTLVNTQRLSPCRCDTDGSSCFPHHVTCF